IFPMLQSQTLDIEANKYAFGGGSINAIVKDNAGNTYVGGGFTSVSLWSGNGVEFNSTTGVQNTAFPKVGGGNVHSVVAIPSGYGAPQKLDKKKGIIKLV
ncbi:MAG TPA: hypothetical protein PKO16_09185, partial [Bacteroidia bacterium]|nr:hypothetical protein [Bacteroidia bacterium]